MSDLKLFIPIGKIDEAKRIVYGTLTAEIPDKSGEMFDYSSGKPAVQAWSDGFKATTGGKSLGNVRAMHENIAAGKFIDIVYDDENKSIQGAAKIVDDDEWEKVKEGVYSGFSIGGKYTRRWQDPANANIYRFTPELTEVSLVDNPCVPTATFEYIKADGSVELRKFHHQSEEDIMELNKGGAGASATDEAALIKAAEEATASGTATEEQTALIAKRDADAAAKPELVKDGKPVKPRKEPVQHNVWKASDGSEHPNKRAAEVHELHLEKAVELAPALPAMNAILEKANKPAEDEDKDAEGDDDDTKAAKKERRDAKAAKAKKEADDKEADEKAAKEKADGEKAAKEKDDAEKAAAAALTKKDYTDDERKAMAGKEAMEDGSFPIKTKKDLENAIKASGRAKDKDAAKKHIIARAKALKLTDELPADWEGSSKKKDPEKAATADLQKSMCDVARTAHVIEELQWLAQGVTFEEALEGDNSTAPAEIKAIIEKLCAYLVARVKEETDELIEAHGDDDDDVIEMSAGLPAGHIDAIAKFTRAVAAPLLKSDSKTEAARGDALAKFAGTLEKAGARHSKADAERLQSVHDGLADMHKSMGYMVEKCADMHKAAGMMKNTAIDMGAEGEHVDDEEAGDDNRGAQKVVKAFEALNAKSDELLAVTKLATTQNETLLKAIPLIESLQKQVADAEVVKAELAKRVDHLERQPAAPKGHVRAISKAQDGAGTEEGKAVLSSRRN